MLWVPYAIDTYFTVLKMDTFAVCMTAFKGRNCVQFSSVASVKLQGDFQELFETHKGGNKDVELSEVKIATGPQGPWQSVHYTEKKRKKKSRPSDPPNISFGRATQQFFFLGLILSMYAYHVYIHLAMIQTIMM